MGTPGAQLCCGGFPAQEMVPCPLAPLGGSKTTRDRRWPYIARRSVESVGVAALAVARSRVERRAVEGALEEVKQFRGPPVAKPTHGSQVARQRRSVAA